MRTEKQASISTKKFLPHIVEQGYKKQNDFVLQCQENSCRFEKPVTKTKILNFSTENFGKKNKSKIASKITQTKGTRDMFKVYFIFLPKSKLISVSYLSIHCFQNQPALLILTEPPGTVQNQMSSHF